MDTRKKKKRENYKNAKDGQDINISAWEKSTQEIYPLSL